MIETYPADKSLIANDIAGSHNPCEIYNADCVDLINQTGWKSKFNLILTSPPYANARKKHYDGVPPENYVEWFKRFSEPFHRALADDGSFIIVIKDCVRDGQRVHYVWDVINYLSANGWYCIEDYIWHKPNPFPGLWPTRLRDGWEYCFHLAKSKKPYFNSADVKQPVGDWALNCKKTGRGREKSKNGSGFAADRDKFLGREHVSPTNVISCSVGAGSKKQYKHPAVFPVDLVSFFIKLLCPVGGLVLDPFAGSGNAGVAAIEAGRRCILIDNKKEYCDLMRSRINKKIELV